MDAALIAAARRTEHYEIVGYGTAAHYADRLDHAQADGLLQQALDKENFIDNKLDELAINYLNQKAEQRGPRASTQGLAFP
jgi:ferritin-like metal-binding protein YciE